MPSKKHHSIPQRFIKDFFGENIIIYDQNGHRRNPTSVMFDRRINSNDPSINDKTKLLSTLLPKEDYLEEVFSKIENLFLGDGKDKIYNILKKDIHDMDSTKIINICLVLNWLLFCLFLDSKDGERLRHFSVYEQLIQKNSNKIEISEKPPKGRGDLVLSAFYNFFSKNLTKTKIEMQLSKMSILVTEENFILTNNLFSYVTYKKTYGWGIKDTIILVPFDKNHYLMFEVRPDVKETKLIKSMIIKKSNFGLNEFDIQYFYRNLVFSADYFILSKQTTTFLNNILILQSKKYLGTNKEIENMNIRTVEVNKKDIYYWTDKTNAIKNTNPSVIISQKSYKNFLKNIKKSKMLTKKMKITDYPLVNFDYYFEQYFK